MPFGIGPGELILILVMALIVFGPKRLPELGGSMGKAIREFRRASSELTRELSDGLQESRPAVPQVTPSTLESKCADCGTMNLSQNKFCGNCGKTLEQLPDTK